MACALKRIAVEVHNFPMYGRILVRISSRSGLNHTTYGLLYVLLSVLLDITRAYIKMQIASLRNLNRLECSYMRRKCSPEE